MIGHNNTRYTKYRCRCDECRADHAAVKRAAAKRHRDEMAEIWALVAAHRERSAGECDLAQ